MVLAASNKQIAEQLFLSVRTVAAHLYRSFPKLGVTSRAGLRDALASAPPRRGSLPDQGPLAPSPSGSVSPVSAAQYASSSS